MTREELLAAVNPDWAVYGHLWWQGMHQWYVLLIVAPIAILIAAWLLYGLLNQCRDACALRAAPMPAAPGNPACERCSDRDIIARCTCEVTCPGRRFDCVGDHTSMAALTAKEWQLLETWIKEGRG